MLHLFLQPVRWVAEVGYLVKNLFELALRDRVCPIQFQYLNLLQIIYRKNLFFVVLPTEEEKDVPLAYQLIIVNINYAEDELVDLLFVHQRVLHGHCNPLKKIDKILLFFVNKFKKTLQKGVYYRVSSLF